MQTYYVTEPDAYTRQLYASSPDVELDEKVEASSEIIFGRVLEKREWGELVGAVAGAQVAVGGYNNSVYIAVKHPRYEQERSIFTASQGVVTLDNEHFARLDLDTPDYPRGLGTRVIATQVRAAQRLGIKEINCTASGSPNTQSNGYYTWPRLGFDGALSSEQRALYAAHTGRSAPPTVLELLALSGGKDWWRGNGSMIDVTFDLTKNSISHQILLSYLEEKGIWLE